MNRGSSLGAPPSPGVLTPGEGVAEAPLAGLERGVGLAVQVRDFPFFALKKTIVFLFSEKIGFKAYYDKTYYDVKFPEFLNNGKKSYLPQVTERLIHDSFFAGAKAPELAGRVQGG